MASFFYKPQHMALVVALNDGRRLRYNFVPGLARGGFLLSPLIADRSAYADLAASWATPNLAGLEVVTVAVVLASSDDAVCDYQTPVQWRFYSMDLAPRE
jgi:hypothetical protein